MSDISRSCGTCTVCCRLTAVPELNKPVNIWCGDCEIGKGCRRYESRPPSCASFSCMWLSGDFEDWARPDRCKVMFERLHKSATILALLDPGRPDAWKTKQTGDLIMQMLQDGNSVLTTAGLSREKNIFLPKGKTREEVLEDLRIEAEYQRIANGGR